MSCGLYTEKGAFRKHAILIPNLGAHMHACMRAQAEKGFVLGVTVMGNFSMKKAAMGRVVRVFLR